MIHHAPPPRGLRPGPGRPATHLARPAGTDEHPHRAVRRRAGSWVLPGVTVVDVDGARGPVSVVVSGSTIAAILDGTVVPANAEPLDVAGGWVSPGRVDPHVHLFLSGTRSWVGDPLRSALRATVVHGVTTVVDAGAPLQMLPLRTPCIPHPDAHGMRIH